MSIIVQNTPNNTSLPVSGCGGILPENQGCCQKVQKAAQESLADENSYRSGWLNVSGCSRRWNRYVFSKNGDVYTFKFHSGDVYRGQFAKGRFNGQGRFVRANGSVYEGAFLNGKYHGKGILKDSEGNVYRGQFAHGRFNGQGLYIRKNGCVYAGAFLNGKMHGKGTLKDSEGSVYKGRFADGELIEGRCEYSNGSVYMGGFLNGLRHGEGILLFANGDIYEGPVANGQRNGLGRYTFKSGSVYVGQFLNDKFHGNGTCKFANGSVYEGEYLNDLRHGQGQITYFDRTCIKGRFEHGHLVDANCSNLSDIKFLKLLIGAPTGGCPASYALGVITDYLIKNFYIEFGIALKSALKFLLNEELDREQNIQELLTSCNGPQLFAIEAENHGAGLNMELLSNSEEVLLEIFNSGEELESFHPRQDLESKGKKKTKYQTMVQFIVPLEGLASLKTDELLKPANMKELYEKISAIPGARVVKQDFPIWQSEQKADNCPLEWIFAYLKNKMTNERYIRFRMRFFEHCADLIQNNGLEDRDMFAAFLALVKKIKKRKQISLPYDELDIDIENVYKYRF